MHAPRISAPITGLLLAALASVVAPSARADAPIVEYDAVVDTTAFAQQKARLVFTLTNGDTAADALVQISDVDTNGSIGTKSTMRGNVVGFLGTGIVLDDRSSMTTQFVQNDFVLGTSLSFHVKATNLHSAPDKPYDAVTLHVLNAQANTPVLPTDDPTRGHAVFLLELGRTDPAQRLTVFQKDSVFQPWSATVTPVPEPASAGVAIVALAALALRRRQTTR